MQQSHGLFAIAKLALFRNWTAVWKIRLSMPLSAGMIHVAEIDGVLSAIIYIDSASAAQAAPVFLPRCSYGDAVLPWASVRPSARLSVCQTRELWQNERNSSPHSYTIWKVDASSFPTRRMDGWWGTSPSTWYFKSWKTPTLNRYSFVAFQP